MIDDVLIGTKMAPTWPMISRTSGGGLPSYLMASRSRRLRPRERFLQGSREKALPVPEWLCKDTSEHAHPYSKEGETGHLVVEVMDTSKYNRICLKCKIENTQKQCIP